MTSFSLQWYRISFRFSNKCKSFWTDIRRHYKRWIKRNTQSSGFVLHCELVEHSANSAGYCGVCFVREFLIANKASHHTTPYRLFVARSYHTNKCICYGERQTDKQTKINWTFKSIFFDNITVANITFFVVKYEHKSNEFYKILSRIKVLRNLSGKNILRILNTYCIEQVIQCEIMEYEMNQLFNQKIWNGNWNSRKNGAEF